MKKILLTAVAGAALIAGCGGVDREGTRDNIVKELESLGTVDKDCVDDVLDKYSDDELKAMDKEAEELGSSGTPSEELMQYTTEVFGCISGS